MRGFLFLKAVGAVTAPTYCALLNGAVDNLVTFGDSLTDEGRLDVYLSRNGTAPEPGMQTSGSNRTASGGHGWGYYAAKQLLAKHFDYGTRGAFCTNTIFSRFVPGTHRTFPSVLEDQILSYHNDVTYINASTGNNTFFPTRQSSNTVYALWIGTNDLGPDAFFTDSQAAEYSLESLVECFWAVFDAIYATGGRRFVLFQQAPLERSPLYAAPEHGGVLQSVYWPSKTAQNMTGVEGKMSLYTKSVNAIVRYGAPFQHLVAARWPGACVSIFDTHRLLTNIADQPSTYLDEPAQATGFYRHCHPLRPSECVHDENPISSFLWYDELHPSYKVDQVIGTEFARAVQGDLRYTTNW